MRMELDDMRKFVEDSGVEIWAVINTALAVAFADYPQEFKLRRDQVPMRVYTSSAVLQCQNCDTNENGHSEAVAGGFKNRYKSREQTDELPATKHSHDYEQENGDEDKKENCGERDSENRQTDVTIVSELMQIKKNLEDDQSDEYLLGLLQRLLEMKISMEALKESAIGRKVSALRKHSSTQIRKIVKRKIVKQLIKNWKGVVDDWVNATREGANTTTVDEASPQGGVEIPRKNAVEKGMTSLSASEMLASTRKRLREGYQEAENAKKRRQVQVIDPRDIPKRRNSLFFHGRGRGYAKH